MKGEILRSAIAFVKQFPKKASYLEKPVYDGSML